MLNNFYKTIHNKYSRFFKFIFFLRYLLIIFFISIVVFLITPTFFDYKKKSEVIKLYLLENYNFEISNYEKIKYNIFPLPNLELINVQINLKSLEENLSVKKIKIYPNLLNIYNYKNFNSNKVTFKDGDIKFQIYDLKFFANQLFYQKKKLSFKNLNLKLMDEKIPVITFNNINFANYGYNDNLIKGKVFDKNFKVKIDDDYKNINFKLLNSGINADINFSENQKENLKIGVFKSKMLNTNFKSNFEYDGKVLKIYNSHFRSKNLSFKNKSEIILKPFLDINSKFNIEELSSKIFTKVDLTQLLQFKDFLRKINNKSELSFKSKKFNHFFFDDLNLKINLAYGRMNYSKKLSIANNNFQCEGSINLLEEYPLLFFNCSINTESKREFLKLFSIKNKDKDKTFKLNFKGNLNVLNRKVNFRNISNDDNYIASKEDLKYLKNTFESIFLSKNNLEIFNLKKIKEFIIEIS